jgi:hypothetical protein
MRSPPRTVAKLLAWFAIANGLFTVATPVFLLYLSRQTLPQAAIVLFMQLGGTSLVAGYYGQRGKPWAFWLLFATFFVQVAEYFSETFFFSFIGPLSLKIGWGWHSPSSHFNVNVLAIAVCILAARSAIQSGRQATTGSSPESSAEA